MLTREDIPYYCCNRAKHFASEPKFAHKPVVDKPDDGYQNREKYECEHLVIQVRLINVKDVSYASNGMLMNNASV